MKYLYLLRHAHTLKNPGEIDINRNLSSLGIDQATDVGKYLNNLPKITLVKLSIAKRTLATYENLHKTLNYQPLHEVLPELYYTSPEEIIRIIQDTSDDIQTLMILSHNPSITNVVNNLNINLPNPFLKQALDHGPTAKLVLIECETKSWHEIVAAKKTIKDVYIPKQK